MAGAYSSVENLAFRADLVALATALLEVNLKEFRRAHGQFQMAYGFLLFVCVGLIFNVFFRLRLWLVHFRSVLNVFYSIDFRRIFDVLHSIKFRLNLEVLSTVNFRNVFDVLYSFKISS